MKNFTLSGQVLLPAILRNFFTVFIMVVGVRGLAAPGPTTPEATNSKSFTVVFTQQPAPSTVCEGSAANFSVAATGSKALSYQWQVSTDGGTTWSAVSNGAVYSGATASNLQISTVPASMNGYNYRCIVSDGTANTSSPALLTVNPAPTVQSANIAVQVCINGSATITAANYSGLSYQWEVNTGSGFTNVINSSMYSGATTSMLRITGAQAFMEGYIYRYVATNTVTGCSAVSGLDTLHVLPYAAITQQPVTTTACPGSDASFTIDATGVSSMKWQVSTNGSVWTDVPDNAMYSGVTEPTLTISGVALSMNNYRYRAVLYNALSCPVSSNMVFLFVRPVTAITAQPASTTVCATNTATFKVTATGSSLSYQWQTDNGTNGATWTNISPGGTGSTLNRTNVSMSMNGYKFRVIVNGFCGSVISSEATLQTQRGTWLGITSTDWHTASNWCGGVPDSTTDVLIPAGAPNMPDIISGIGYSKSLTIEPNAKLTVSGGTTQMSGPFAIQGTVAYTGLADQLILPATHSSLEIDGSGKKYLQASTDVYQNLVLNGAAKLVTSNYILTMRAGSNPVSGSNLTDLSSSWIVTGNGNAGTVNTGLGGLQYEEIRPQDGSVLFPIGPTDSAYNPLFLENKGVRDRFTVSVNDQPIPGSFAGRTINRTWKVMEGTAGGSMVTLDLKWNKPEEQPLFDSLKLMMVRSDNSMIIETQPVTSRNNRSFAKANTNDFLVLSAFSLESYTGVDYVPLPVKIRSFTGEKLNSNAALLRWSVEDETGADYYSLQKSAYGDKGFSDIALIKAEHNKGQYQFTDQQIASGANYYRLRTVSQNGISEFSPVVKIVNDQGKARFQLRPSITTTASTNLFFSVKTKERFTVSLSNSTGQLQWVKIMEVPAGNSVQPVDLSKLGKGIYFICISGNGFELQRLTLIKQ